MSLVNCKTCGARISKNAGKCPQCGENTESTGTKVIMLGFVGLIALGVVIYIVGLQEQRAQEETVRSYKKALDAEAEENARKLKILEYSR